MITQSGNMVHMPYKTHLDFIRERETKFDELLRDGAFSPLLLQQSIGTFFLLLVPLVIVHRSTTRSRILRYGFHAVITAFCAYTILGVRFLGPANGYATGLITTWFFIWSTIILLVHDVQKEFKRIIRNPVINTDDGNEQSRSSKVVNGVSKDSGVKRRTAQKNSVVVQQQQSRTVYIWQPFPQKLSDRLDWVSDLIFNFRGPNWNWRLRSFPSLPRAVLQDIDKDTSSIKQTKIPQQSNSQSASVKLQYTLLSFFRDYMALDLLKLILMRDPYFWGYTDNPPSPPWPFDILAWSPVLVRSYRTLLSLASVIFALDIITSLNPLFFLGISHCFPNFARAITHQPLDEAWLYPDAFGSAWSVLDHGLVGAWNSWWHQLFRFGFSECSRFLTDLILPSGGNISIQGESYKSARHVLQIMLAFSLSGLVHAMASYTTFSDSRPWNDFLFFVLQGVGALAQYFTQVAIIPAILPESVKPPRWLIRSTNFILIVLWFYYTGPLIADDFARSGIWMFEPIPVSVLRGGLGLGVDGDHWWCWRGSWFEWYSGATWWQSGIRLV